MYDSVIGELSVRRNSTDSKIKNYQKELQERDRLVKKLNEEIWRLVPLVKSKEVRNMLEGGEGPTSCDVAREIS